MRITFEQPTKSRVTYEGDTVTMSREEWDSLRQILRQLRAVDRVYWSQRRNPFGSCDPRNPIYSN